MPLFKIQDKKLHFIEEQPFKLEKDMQNICEANIEKLLKLMFVKSEFSINEFRIDTLAYDDISNYFTIIEYKRDKNFSVIDQGYAYLSLMLNNKAEFILEFNETTGKNIRRQDVDWSQSKVIFISTAFTNYQKEAINFKNLPIELWEIRRYSNETIAFNQLMPKGSKESIATISKESKEMEIVSKEIRVYTEEDHLFNGSDETIELYNKIKKYTLEIADDIEVKPKKHYIAFINVTNFCDVAILKKSLKIWINLPFGELKDSKNIARNVNSIGHHGNGDYEIQISDDKDIEYIVSLIKESYFKIRERSRSL